MPVDERASVRVRLRHDDDVVRGATPDEIGFVFHDAHGYRVDRWPLLGPRIRYEPAPGVAQCATPGEPPPALDGRWLRDHLHWFADGPRGLVVRPEYRDAFERLAPRTAPPRRRSG